MSTAISSVPATASVTTASSPGTKSSGTPSGTAGLVAAAVSLSTNASVVATLGGGSASAQTYDAAGLLNSLIEAGTPSSTSIPVPASGTNTSQLAQSTVDQGVANTLASSNESTNSGVYSSSGTVQGTSASLTANWAKALKTNSGLAGTVIGDSYAQGIIASLNVTV